VEIRSSSRRVRQQDIEETVRLRSLLGAGKVIYPGPVTGRIYEFIRAEILEVNKDDADIMLQRMKGGCCGGKPSPYFDLVL